MPRESKYNVSYNKENRCNKRITSKIFNFPTNRVVRIWNTETNNKNPLRRNVKKFLQSTLSDSEIIHLQFKRITNQKFRLMKLFY